MMDEVCHALVFIIIYIYISRGRNAACCRV